MEVTTMALINCPECGKEISDKSSACLHCGYPLSNDNINIDSNNIETLFSSFAMNITQMKIRDIYQDVLNEVLKIKSSNINNSNDIIAKSIIDGLIKKPNNVSWIDVKLFCELIDFSLLSPETIDYFSNKVFEVISIKEKYSDGSGGYNNITPYFFAIHKAMQYSSESSKEKLMSILNTPYMGSNSTIYDYVEHMYNEKANTSTETQIKQYDNFVGTNNNLKCSVCGSTNISRISSVGRLTSVFAFGLASSKLGKQYECKNCKYKW